MSESAQPLSRRERREMEEAARLAEGDATQALPVAPESISVASRRERRRMERLAHPVETWTAEEEMIATGQMPAMTPDLIAEHEQLAREKSDADRAAAAAAAAYDATVPDAVVESAPVVESASVVESAPVEEAPEPAASVESAPVAVSAPVDAAPEPAAPVDSAPVQPAPANEIPADLRHLFPPGSLQARAFAAQQNAAPGPESDNPADEIRRLTHEAMAGIARANTDATPIVPGGEFEPVEFVAPEPAAETGVPELPEGVDVEALWNAPTVDEPLRASIFPGADADSEVNPEASQSDLSRAPLVQDVPSVTSPNESEAEEAAAVWSTLVPAISARPAVNQDAPTADAQGHAQAAPVQAAPAQPAPSMWDTHPLTHPGATPVRELPSDPVQQNLPRPDLTALMGAQATSGVGQPTYQPAELSTSTTSIPQRLPEPHAGGGARHFRWAHLAVIGAIAFVLGIVAWNIARAGS